MIVAVAQRYFLEHGYAATTMSGIAAALGGSKGTLWTYFRSKEELFAAALADQAHRYQAELSQLLDPSIPVQTALERACASLFKKITSPEAIAVNRLIIAEGARFPQIARMFFDLAPKNTRALLATFIGDAMARGSLRKADPSEAAQALTALLMGGIHKQLLLGGIDDVDQNVARAEVHCAVDLFLRAYAPSQD
ncbi:MAG: TetR/AcrR family transcriptional regulator [Sphingobium sp.]|uniref:TetR/AcrR family transcriptional regulator n=1 Tax=Sphingobium sp. TaxID=1912891 RepID=UPI002E22E8F8